MKGELFAAIKNFEKKSQSRNKAQKCTRGMWF